MKVGDHICSHDELNVPTNPFGRCKYCNNLSRPTKEQGSIFRGQELRLKHLCNEKWNPDCLWCAVLARCIQLLEPETSKMVKESPEQLMWCVINRHNAISICWNYTRNVKVIERCSFQLYRSPTTEQLLDDVDIPTCPELAPEPGHELMWSYLRQCLMKCLWNHSECRKAQQLDWFPKRLLYLEDTGGVHPNMRIVETDKHHPSGPYIALSHCWGEAQPLRSLTTNFISLQQSIEFEDLTAVFQNCVTTAKKFGVNYVWIDSLCIIQDDRVDWTVQSRQMHRIYENAILVVAAVSSEDGSVPFLGPKAPNGRHLRTSHPVTLSTLPGVPGNLRARRYVSTIADLTDSRGPLKSRAWCWQEHVLSTRIIHFTENQSIWECLETRGSEMMGSLERRSDSLKIRLSGSENIEKVWQYAIHEYGKRYLTYSTDRLPALSGVAARFEPLFKTQYCAGLWRERMVLDLAWEHAEILSFVTSKISPSLGNSVPSWSWASIRGSPFYGLDNHFSEAIIQYSIHDVNCKPSTDNPLGEVCEGSYVHIAGKYVSAILVTDERGFAVVKRNGFEPQLVIPDCQLTQTTQVIDGMEMPTLRRALPSETRIPKGNETISTEAEEKLNGVVFCFLLFSGNVRKSNTESAIVLILAPVGPKLANVQRVALGRGGVDKLDTGGSSIVWQWTNYETWENWEGWFADAKSGSFQLL